jgi:hypothetical protein
VSAGGACCVDADAAETVGNAPSGGDEHAPSRRGDRSVDSRLKEDASLPVPKGFTQSIERMRRNLQMKLERQDFAEKLARGFVERSVRSVILAPRSVCSCSHVPVVHVLISCSMSPSLRPLSASIRLSRSMSPAHSIAAVLV